MISGPFLGVLFHAIGGFAAGSFYIPFKKVRGWAWETYWLVGGLFIWVICPLIAAWKTVPDLLKVYQVTTWNVLIWTFLFGVGWGVGHLTFGLSLRYLGLSLGMGLSLGLVTFFGTAIPLIYKGTLLDLFYEKAGLYSLGGLAICLLGIFFMSWAGISKERELTEEAKRETIAEFSFTKGVCVATFSGIMSACFWFGVTAGDTIQKTAANLGALDVYANNAPLLLILIGGGVSNVLFCVAFNIRRGSGRNYVDHHTPLARNYFFCTLAGIIAYAEFFFLGMGEFNMGKYSFSSVPVHMALVIVFSNVWGIIFREWKGTSLRTRWLLVIGLLALVGSTFVSAYGSYLKG